jgi:hypothetical protein
MVSMERVCGKSRKTPVERGRSGLPNPALAAFDLESMPPTGPENTDARPRIGDH